MEVITTRAYRAQDNKLAYRISDLADATGLSHWFVRREIQNGKLKARKFGSAVLILHDDAVAWLQAHTPLYEDAASNNGKDAE